MVKFTQSETFIQTFSSTTKFSIIYRSNQNAYLKDFITIELDISVLITTQLYVESSLFLIADEDIFASQSSIEGLLNSAYSRARSVYNCVDDAFAI